MRRILRHKSNRHDRFHTRRQNQQAFRHRRRSDAVALRRFPRGFRRPTPRCCVTIDALEVPLWCERFERRGQPQAPSPTFADFDTERRAQELVGLEFRIRDERRGGRRRILHGGPDRLRRYGLRDTARRHRKRQQQQQQQQSTATATAATATKTPTAAATIAPTPPPATARPRRTTLRARSPTTTTATPIRCSSWRSADGGCWSPPSRSSSPASTSRGARCTWCCPKGCLTYEIFKTIWHAW